MLLCGYKYGLLLQSSYFLSPKTWNWFRDDIFMAWEHETHTLPSTDEIKFTTEIADQEKGLKFLDLRIKCVEGELLVDFFTKRTNSIAY